MADLLSLTDDELVKLLCCDGAERMVTNDSGPIQWVLLRNRDWDEPWMQLQTGSAPILPSVLQRIGRNYIRSLMAKSSV